MKRLFIAVLWLSSVVASAHISPATFQGWIKDSRVSTNALQGTLAPAKLEHAQRARYVFVNGYGGDFFTSAFIDMMADLQGLGVPRSHILKIVPSSNNTMDQNLALLKEKLTPILEGNDDPIVLVGHSRGAVETLAFALGAPKDVRDRIHGLYLIHGAFGGSPIADFVVGESVPMDDRLPSPIRGFMERIQKLDLGTRVRAFEKATGIQFGEGLMSLTHKAQTEFWVRHVKQNRAAADELNDRIYYIRGYDHPANMSWLLRFPATYMDIYYGVNDGVIPFAYQAVEGLGTPLVTLRESHNGLVSEKVTGALRTQRRAVMGAIFLATANE